MERVKVISGGQTGVDRAALDAAADVGIDSGGWCPRGRLAEDGMIAEKYDLIESASPIYAVRTRLNVKDSDGTLILNSGESLSGGTALTAKFAKSHSKPLMVIDISKVFDATSVTAWMHQNSIKVLNIAGPRETTCPGIYEEALRVVKEFLCESLDPCIS